MKPSDNVANMQNANRGTSGQNRQHAQAQGNRGAQLSPKPGSGHSGKGGKI